MLAGVRAVVGVACICLLVGGGVNATFPWVREPCCGDPATEVVAR